MADDASDAQDQHAQDYLDAQNLIDQIDPADYLVDNEDQYEPGSSSSPERLRICEKRSEEPKEKDGAVCARLDTCEPTLDMTE